MNNLLTQSFEMGRHQSREDDVELGYGTSPSNRASDMDTFFKKVGDIDAQIGEITIHLHNLEVANTETHSVTKASTMKEIKLRMERDIEEVGKVALKAKKALEVLEKDNLANRQKPGCGSGTSIDRSRMVMTTTMKKKLKERMADFQVLRQTIHDEYREAVGRRVYTVTGVRPDEETIDNLIETGDSEQIFAKAIQGHGRGQIMDTVAEIQERCDTVKEIERKLYELQQMFMDLSVLVESQGDLLNDIETQVSSAVDHVQAGTKILQKGKKLQRNTRIYMCIAVIVLLIIIAIALTTVLKELIHM